MKNNWPETVDELIKECENLIGRDLYTLGERGEPFAGEDEPRVDGTDYLAGEYQYGVMMIPAQWVTNVISSNALVTGTCQVDTTENWLPAERYHRCKHCGVFFAVLDASSDIPPRFCPNCGKRIEVDE